MILSVHCADAVGQFEAGLGHRGSLARFAGGGGDDRSRRPALIGLLLIARFVRLHKWFVRGASAARREAVGMSHRQLRPSLA
ncbi:hypothetical protein B0T41_18710 [Chromobacterium violaceum]|nr:hypothetical protein B0T41_18710 [Chromobacterium violaceum]